jgi:hypothetical protein
MTNLNKGKIQCMMSVGMYAISSRDEKITIEGKEYTITRKMFTFRTTEKTVHGK